MQQQQKWNVYVSIFTDFRLAPLLRLLSCDTFDVYLDAIFFLLVVIAFTCGGIFLFLVTFGVIGGVFPLDDTMRIGVFRLFTVE